MGRHETTGRRLSQLDCCCDTLKWLLSVELSVQSIMVPMSALEAKPVQYIITSGTRRHALAPLGVQQASL